LRILYVSDSYPPIVNGLSYVVDNLAKSMVRLGHKVDVATIRTSGHLPRLENVDGVRVRRFFGLSPGGSYHLPSPGILGALRGSYDVVHVHNFHSVFPILGAMFSPKDSNSKFVVTAHYHTLGHHWHSRLAWKVQKPLLTRLLRRYSVVHCVSQFEALRVQRDFGVRSIVIPNGVSDDVYDFKWRGGSDNVITITYAGRMEKYKRVSWVLLAAKILADEGVRVKVLLLGTGPQSARLERQAQDLRIDLSMPGYLPRREYLDSLAGSDCFANPSSQEAFSIVSAEALAIGVPVVCVKPWGENFSGYPRAIIVDPNPMAIAMGLKQAAATLKSPAKHVPTWADVASELIEKAYM
jgi:glycosyltransferase involved in cell wall biosynthesis